MLLYLAAYVAIVLLGRRRVRRFRASMWLDGIIGVFAVGCLAATALDTPVLVASRASVVKAGLDIAYPLTDVLLVGIIVLMLALGSWRAGRPFAMLALGFVAMAIADSIYLYQEAHGGYVAGTPLDSLWLLSALMLAYAAWQPDGASPSERDSSLLVMAAPVLFGAIAITILAYGNATKITGMAIWLASRDALSGARQAADHRQRKRPPDRREHRARKPRRADRASQPPGAAAGLGVRRRPCQRLAAEPPSYFRSQRLQALQRHLRSPGRRRALKRLGGKLAESASPDGVTYRSAATSSARCCPAAGTRRRWPASSRAR